MDIIEQQQKKYFAKYQELPTLKPHIIMKHLQKFRFDLNNVFEE